MTSVKTARRCKGGTLAPASFGYSFWMTSLGRAALGSLWAAALSTAGDFVWARFIPSHHAIYGLIHGTALCLGIGLFLGALRRQPVRGSLWGGAIGFGAAAGFYGLAPLVGYSAMFVLWMALWVGFGVLEGRGFGPPLAPAREALARGLLAALGSGAAFYLVSDIWTRPRPGGPDYAHHFLCWTIAFLPGFFFLLAQRAEPRG
jgi:hypothetical protein